MRKWIIGILGVLVAAGGIFWTTADDDMRRLILHMPTNKDALFWSIPQRDAAFRAMDRMPILVKSRIIPCGTQVYPLPKGEPLEIGADVDAYMSDQRSAALVIVHEGNVRLEKYGYGYGYQSWTLDDGTYFTRGIFGQAIFIDPKRKLVMASNSDWPQASDLQGGDQGKKRLAFFRQVQLAIDKEATP